MPFGVEGWLLKSIGKKWRNFKASLKDKHYDPTQPMEILMAKRPSRVLEDQWRRLLAYWGIDTVKVKSEFLIFHYFRMKNSLTTNLNTFSIIHFL